MDYSTAFDQLNDLGATKVAHWNGDLQAHLLGTHNLLRAWGNSDDICLAGLYHAVYGTDGFPSQLVDLSDRLRIASIIGRRAEELAYLYAACDRDTVYPQIGRSEPVIFSNRFTRQERPLPREELADLCELTLANELEIVANDPSLLTKDRQWYEDLFDRFCGIVSEAGFSHYRRLLARPAKAMSF